MQEGCEVERENAVDVKGWEAACEVETESREERADNRREFTIKKEWDGKQIIFQGPCRKGVGKADTVQ